MKTTPSKNVSNTMLMDIRKLSKKPYSLAKITLLNSLLKNKRKSSGMLLTKIILCHHYQLFQKEQQKRKMCSTILLKLFSAKMTTRKNNFEKAINDCFFVFSLNFRILQFFQGRIDDILPPLLPKCLLEVCRHSFSPFQEAVCCLIFPKSSL